jgi:uncharacterized cupin superfamily protein
VVPQAPLERTEHGLLPAGEGWFVLNAREAAWRECPGMGKWLRLKGERQIFPQLGFGITVLEPGERMAMYHWEVDQEDFLVLSGEALATSRVRSGRCRGGTSCTARRGRTT